MANSTNTTLKAKLLKAALKRPVKGLTVREAWDKGIGTTYSSVRARMYELADSDKLFRDTPDGEVVKRNGALVFFAV